VRRHGTLRCLVWRDEPVMYVSDQSDSGENVQNHAYPEPSVLSHHDQLQPSGFLRPATV